MKIKTRIGQMHPNNMPSFYNSSLTETTYVQDSIHTGLKIRNKLLQPSVLLPMGNRQVSLSHLKILITEFPKTCHGLVLNDICPDDRQNFEALRKVMSPNVTQCLQENVPESEATALYLKLCRYVTSAFIDPKLSPLDRVHRIWFAISYLRIWRRWISQIERESKTYTTKDNFVTPNAYECIEINGHALIQIMIKLRNDGKPEQFIPILLSSQPCESTFRQFRSMTSIYWTKINSTLLEMFHIVGRIELQNFITHHKIPDVKFPRSQDKIPKMDWHELPSDDQIFHQMRVARDDAINSAKQFDIHFDPEEDMICQLPVCEPRPGEFGENDDTFAMEEADILCESIKEINLANDTEEILNHSATCDFGLRDYTDQNRVIDELCPFTENKDKNGKIKVVRKSSALWSLLNTKSSLSVDRLQRVQGKAIEKANKRTLSKTQCTTVNAAEDDTRKVALVWREEELHIGDWCFFLGDEISSSLDDLFVGQIVGFKYIVGKTAKEKQYSWDNAPVSTQIQPKLRRGIEVLATWYGYRENGSIVSIESEVKHFFKNIIHYVGTTKAIEQPSCGKTKLKSTQLIYLNQQLLNLLGM